jgi:hypothetical protein
MLARMISLKNKETKLDGKVLDLLDKTHANSQTLVDVKSMFPKLLGKLKDQANLHLDPKSIYEE